MTCGWTLNTGPFHMGPRRPENRVAARSKLPQKKCTGLDLPRKRPRNSLNTVSTRIRICQNAVAAAGS